MRATAIIHAGAEERRAEFDAPLHLGELLKHGGAAVDQPCGGQGKCGKCRVRASGALQPPSERELARLKPEELSRGVRLACLAVAEGDVEIWLNARSDEAIMTEFNLPALPDDPWGDGLGLAVDIGTTTLAAYLYDLSDRRTLAVSSRPNPQRAFGADVTSRLKVSLEQENGGESLRACIAEALGALSAEVLASANRSAAALKCAVVTGNTAMLYLLTGMDVHSIAFAPFEPSTRFGISVSGDRIGLPAHVRAWLPECVAAYVGADITCAMLYAGFYPDGSVRSGAPVLLADIGTNGEMALSANGRIYACSTAAGPAFEGAGIRCGMTAREGAIQRVDLTEDGLKWTVVGDGPAKGICGSGLVDAVAALLKAEVIDETGRLEEDYHDFEDCMEEIDGKPAFRFPGTEVVLTQADIRAVQLAKSAICAGMQVLIQEAELSPEDVSELLIAGGFGSCIRPESAEAIGLIPEGFAAKTRAIGNAAGAGATMMLLSDSALHTGAPLSTVSRTIELSSNPAFSDAYIENMLFNTEL